jgi:hypothetical protein
MKCPDWQRRRVNPASSPIHGALLIARRLYRRAEGASLRLNRTVFTLSSVLTRILGEEDLCAEESWAKKAGRSEP